MGAAASIDETWDTAPKEGEDGVLATGKGSLKAEFDKQVADGTITTDQAATLQKKFDDLPLKKKKNDFLVIGLMNKEYDGMGIGAAPAAAAAPAPAPEEKKPAEKKPFPTPPAGFSLKAAPEGTGITICSMTDLPKALEAAKEAKLTPLVMDRSESHACDTFWSYQAQILDAKKMALDVSLRKEPILDVMDRQRKTICGSISFGKTLVFACQTSCPDFKETFNDTKCCGEDTAHLEGKPFTQSTAENKAFIPLDLFDNGGRDYTSQENVQKAEAMFRQEEVAATSGFAKIVEGFNIIVSTHFNYEDLDDFLFADAYGLPPGKFFPIWIQHEDGTAAMAE